MGTCLSERVLEPKGKGLVEDIQRSGSCSVFTDDQRQEDLQRHEGHCQQGQCLLGNTGLHQLQASHCIGGRKADLREEQRDIQS